MPKRVDLLLCKFITYDQSWFTQEALAYSDNSILYFIDFDKIILKHKPDHIKGLPRVIYYPAPKNQKFYSLTFPFFWAPMNILIISILFLYITLRFRPKTVWTDNTWVGGLWSILKKLIGFDCFIYDSRDWIATDSKKSFFSYFANNVVWPRVDYLATVTSDLQINITESRSFSEDNWEIMRWRLINLNCLIIMDSYASNFDESFNKSKSVIGRTYEFLILSTLERESFVRFAHEDIGIGPKASMFRITDNSILEFGNSTLNVVIAQAELDGGTIIRKYFDKETGLLIRQELQYEGVTSAIFVLKETNIVG